MLARSCIDHERSFIFENAVALAAATQANQAFVAAIAALRAPVLGLSSRQRRFGQALRALVDLLACDAFQRQRFLCCQKELLLLKLIVTLGLFRWFNGGWYSLVVLRDRVDQLIYGRLDHGSHNCFLSSRDATLGRG